MAIYRKVVGTTLYLRGSELEGYTLYSSSGGCICGSASLNKTITSVVTETHFMHEGSCKEMFYYCENLTSLDLSSFNTSRVTNMQSMFYNCNKLTSLNLANFNTSRVTAMHYMFRDCYKLTSLNVSNFNTSNVTSMYGMFSDCWDLTSLDLSSFNTSNVTSMAGMFSSCSDLTSLNVSNFNTSNVTSMAGMFFNCAELTLLDLSNFDTSNVTYFSSGTYDPELVSNEGMFHSCVKLIRLKIDNFTKRSDTYAYEMFYGCTTLQTIECKNTFNSSRSTAMFTGCTLLQGETTKGGIAYNSSKTTGTYAKINGGYFTFPKRTLTTTKTGDGTITNGGTYDYGTELSISAFPNSATFQYLNTFTKTIDGITTSVIDGHKLEGYTYSFALNDDMTLNAVFQLRNQRTLSATSTYTIKGTGTYRYLDQPTLIAELGGGLITFNGWYEGSTLFSSQNPCKFVMPDRDLALTIQTGENPFSNENVRQICLQNKDGAVYNLTSKVSSLFLSSPNGFGMSKGYSQTRYGNSAETYDEKYSFSSVSGTLLFYGSTREAIYQDYYDFARFITNAPIELWYKVPLENSSIHHIPVEVTNLSKGEIQTDGMLHCDITMNATGFWKETESSVSASTSTMEVLNDSDFSMGFEITCAKLNGTAFTNPRITFNNGSEYGVIAISSPNGQEYTSIKIVTKDGKQDIILENGDSIITNPFGYIDFSYADGTKQFPFPKLEKGYTTINFIYDNVATEGKSYLIVYDKEFASV